MGSLSGPGLSDSVPGMSFRPVYGVILLGWYWDWQGARSLGFDAAITWTPSLAEIKSF